jgi:hypothetical protein
MMEAEVAIGSLLGIAPSTVRLCAVVAVDDQGKMHVAGPGLVSPDAKRRVVKLLDDAADMLWDQAR